MSRTATAPEIRAAYVRLMKRHHPDTASGGGAADLVADLNRSYATLRDAATRARYDSAIDGSAEADVPPPRDRPAPRRSPHEWMAVVVASSLALGIFTLSLQPALKQDAQALVARTGGWTASGSGYSEAPPGTARSDVADAQRMARLARTLPIAQAEQFSRQCFAWAAGQFRAGSGDACVMFDAAFLYWHKVPGSPVLPAYFADGVFNGRHRDAMADSGAAGEARVRHLRQLAFRGLMQSIEADRLVSRGPTPLPALDPESRAVRDAERRRLAQSDP